MVDGIAPLLHLPDGIIQAHQKALVQILIDRLAQPVHPVEIPGGLNIIRQIDDLLQQRHIRLTGGVPQNGLIDLILHAEHVPGDGGAGLAVQQLQGFPLQPVQLDAVFLAQGQLLLQIQLLGAVVKQRGDPGVGHIRTVLLSKANGFLLRAQHMGHPLGFEIAQGDGPQFLRCQMLQIAVGAVESLAEDIAAHRFRQVLFSRTVGQCLPDICGGHLDHIIVANSFPPGAVGLLQKPLLTSEGLILIGLQAAERTDIGKGQDHIRLVPGVEGQKHIRSHQQPEFILRIPVPQLLQGIAGIALTRSLQLNVKHFCLPADLRCGKGGHLQPLIRGRAALRQNLVGRHTGAG